MTKKQIIAFIPARSGSKGVPDKNIKEINGVSLLAKIVKEAKKSKYITKVVFSTDSFDYAELALEAGADSGYIRNSDLSKDSTTISEVAYDFCRFMNLKQEILFVILQPTSPLRTVEDIDGAIELWLNNKCDTVVAVEEVHGLYWQSGALNRPLFEERVNRQQMIPMYKETGDIVVTTHITEKTTIGEYVLLYPMKKERSVDIDTFDDLWLANVLAQKRKYVIHFKAYATIGYGHLYRSLALAKRLYQHEVILLCSKCDDKAYDILKRQPYKIVYSDNPSDDIIDLSPDILINDILNTDKSYMIRVSKIPLVVNLEDRGDGAKYADFVFNAMYRGLVDDSPNTYYSAKYAVVSENFEFRKKIHIKDNIEKILVTFGGTDPNNITQEIIKTITKKFPEIKFTFVVGPGFAQDRFFGPLDVNNFEVIGPVIDMAHEMEQTDVVITGGGRTVYEAGCCGVPCIVVCQNERELNHIHLNSSYGVFNTGVYREESMDEVEIAINRFKPKMQRLRAQEYITNMIDGMGVYRILGIIEKEWRRLNANL